eukprot:943946-Pleurochrysis_carterae.AAC.1
MPVAFTGNGAGGKLGAGGRKAVDLFEWFKYSLNQRRNDPDLAGLDLHAAKRKLLLKWNSIPENVIPIINSRCMSVDSFFKHTTGPCAQIKETNKYVAAFLEQATSSDVVGCSYTGYFSTYRWIKDEIVIEPQM